MKRCIGMMCVGLLVASLSTACGGDDDVTPADAAVDAAPNPDGGADGGNPIDTFEEFVIDLVQNRTASDTDPAPYVDFSTLPESGDPAAFDVLFP